MKFHMTRLSMILPVYVYPLTDDIKGRDKKYSENEQVWPLSTNIFTTHTLLSRLHWHWALGTALLAVYLIVFETYLAASATHCSHQSIARASDTKLLYLKIRLP